MPVLRIAVALFAVSATVLAQNATLRGIEVGDLNRNVDACEDFFEFSNGAWRAANPIPASMPRWSRRWAAGESTKDKLREILEENSVKNHRQGSVEQLTGDFYSACMNDIQANHEGE